MKNRELLVGRHGETPLVPPYILPSFKMALALLITSSRLSDHPVAANVILNRDDANLGPTNFARPCHADSLYMLPIS